MKPAEQNIFDFPQKSILDVDNFVVSNCNEAAFRAIESWPNWLYFALCLYGPEGCGKSHLATLFAQKVMISGEKLVEVKTIKAEKIKKIAPEKLFEASPCAIVDNLSENVDNEALFHLYNYYRDNGGNLLFLAQKSPAYMRFKLPDLASRMKAVPMVEIGAPDDEMLRILLFKLFNDRQLKVSPEVINYTLNNMTRSFSFAGRLVSEADRISLIKKTPITIAIIKEAMEFLDDDRQGDFFL